MSCANCFRGGVSTAHPAGIETTILGIPTYVAQPEDGVIPKGIIIIITDAFGWKFVNNRVLSDHYAKRGGFLVYCPDFMSGSPLDPRTIDLVDKIMEPASLFTNIFYKPIYVLQAMIFAIPWKIKTRISVTHNLKIGVAGFCWGGKHTILLSQDAPVSRVQRHESQIKSTGLEPLLDCAFTAHPSYIDVPNDIETIVIPISVAIGDEDTAMKVSLVQQMKEILEVKKRDNHEVNIIPGAKHGFAVRTHPNDKHEMECAEKAEVQTIEWFNRWFA